MGRGLSNLQHFIMAEANAGNIIVTLESEALRKSTGREDLGAVRVNSGKPCGN
jgi:hypothetical protein